MDGLVTGECPALWLEEISQVVRAYLYLKQGILPHGGGWAEQPGVLMQLVDTFSGNVIQPTTDD